MKAPKTITLEESEKLLNYLKNNSRGVRTTGVCVRNYAMAVLMLDTGLRVGELVQLIWSDLVCAAQPVHTLRVRAEIAKTKRERTIPLSSRCIQVIHSLMAGFWKRTPTDGSLFVFYTYSPQRHITTRQVERIIAVTGEIAIGRPITPHTLRHTFATRLKDVTDIRTVQELLGHQLLTSTQIYTHPNEQDKVTAINSLPNS